MTTHPLSIPLPHAATAPPRPATVVLVRPALSLARRELVRFLRQRSRVIGSLVTPLIFWVAIGAGMGRSFANPAGSGGGNFLLYFFPGTVLMILLFTAIFSTISIIEDRREGFLQSVLVAPVPRSAIVLGKVLGGTVLAFGQAVLFLLIAPLLGFRPSLPGALGALLMTGLLGFGLTALGFCLAWRMTSTQGFHAIMNLFLMPMWFLSGALFPAAGALGPIRWAMYANPLTYGLDGLRQCLDPRAGGPPFWVCLTISVVASAVVFAIAANIAQRRSTADLAA